MNPVVAISTTAAGAIGLEASRRIYLGSGSRLQTADGGITLAANQQATSTSGNSHGIELYDADISSTNGPILLQGRGNTGTTATHGIYVHFGSTIQSIGSGPNAATITLQGTTGATASNAYGVWLRETGTRVTSQDGDIRIVGQGGGAAASYSRNFGVFVDSPTVIESTGTTAEAAAITLDGTGGQGSSNNTGVQIDGTQSSVSSVVGAIQIIGRGGGTAAVSGASNNYGVGLGSGGQIRSTGTGADAASIVLNGTGGRGTSAFGIYVSGFSNTEISAVTGPIRLTGRGGGEVSTSSSSNVGILIGGGAQVKSTGTSTDTDPITVDGTGGSGKSDNYGVFLSNTSPVTAVAGAIQITGQGGGDATLAGTQNYGVYVWDAGTVTSTGTGTNAATITISGTGGRGSGTTSAST